jgi:DNA-binding response OmpR family regulator
MLYVRGNIVYRIMIVEDDNVICKEITAHLTRWGYEVTAAKNFENITSEFAAVQPHLVLMDISLPFYNGYYWCSEIRRISKLPIMFISSSSDDINIIMAINMGGDDFISKPFSPEVLSAKIQAMLRRSYDFQPQSTLLEHKGVILNLADTTLTIGQKKVELTKNEFVFAVAV